MKRLFFGLAVAATALGASAFTNANSRVAKTYYQTSEGGYVATQPPAPRSCAVTSDNPCTYTFPNDPGLASFTISQLPTLSATYGTPTSANPGKRYN